MIPHRSIYNSKHYVVSEHILNSATIIIYIKKHIINLQTEYRIYVFVPEDGERALGLTVELGVVLEEGLLDAVEEGLV